MGANQSAVDRIHAKQEMERIQKANAMNPDRIHERFVPEQGVEGAVLITILPDAYETLSYSPHLARS